MSAKQSSRIQKREDAIGSEGVADLASHDGPHPRTKLGQQSILEDYGLMRRISYRSVGSCLLGFSYRRSSRRGIWIYAYSLSLDNRLMTKKKSRKVKETVHSDPDSGLFCAI